MAGGDLVLTRAAWLADGVLLMAAHAGAAPAPGEVLASVDVGEAGLSVVAARVPAGAFDGGEALTDLRTFAREELAGLDAASRAAVLAALATLSARDDFAPALAEGLHAVREALRERLPLAVADESAERAVHVEALHRIADDEFYARGWIWDRGGPVAALTAVAPEGERVELAGQAFRYARPDLPEGMGFICHFRTQAPSRRADGWVLEMANEAGRGVETAARLAGGDARDAIVADVGLADPDTEELRERHVLPALTRLQELRHEAVAVGEVETHGAVPAEPEVSVVIPLYERIDLLEHQMAQFADDPEVRACEVLYVLDSPADADHLKGFAGELWRLYGLPFRVAILTGNGGVAIARNRGAEIASGRRILFLDSDVLPLGPGWLGGLAAALDGGAGAVAPKLLYHDGGIQHAGIGFERATDAPEWAAEPRFKGVHADLPAANMGGAVPALSGACLLTDRRLYRELGGMSWMYVKGDYEDADFCLRLAGAGRECRYVPEVALHHLEAQSYPPAARAANRRYNRWLFSRTWDAVLG